MHLFSEDEENTLGIKLTNYEDFFYQNTFQNFTKMRTQPLFTI